jgi:hypothetical protein
VPGLAEMRVQVMELWQRAGIAVQQEAFGAVGCSNAIDDDLGSHLIADVAAGGHDVSNLLGERCLERLHRPKDVTGGDGWDVVALRDAPRLSSFASSGWAHDY